MDVLLFLCQALRIIMGMSAYGGTRMNKFESIVTKTSRVLDTIAGWGIVLTMILVISNIFLRSILNSPIQGIYEYVGFITAVVIAFGLAWCAIQKAHIAIEFIVEKFPQKIQHVIEICTGSLVTLFLLFSSYQVVRHGLKVMASGEVSATSQMQFYPFIFMVALGLLLLSLAELMNVLKGVMRK